MDPNKFSSNFLSLLDGFQAKKPQSRNEEEKQSTKKRDNQSTKDGRGGEFSGGDGNNPKVNREEQRNHIGGRRRNKNDEVHADDGNERSNREGNGEGRRSDNRHYKNDKVHLDSGNERNDKGDSIDHINSNKRNISQERTNVKKNPVNKTNLPSRLGRENMSETFFNALGNFHTSRVEGGSKVSSDYGKEKRENFYARENSKDKNKSEADSRSDGGRGANFRGEVRERNNSEAESRSDGGRGANFRGYRGVWQGIDKNEKGECSHNINHRENDIESRNKRRNFQEREREPETKNRYNGFGKIRHMGYKALESLLDSDLSSVVTTLANPKSGFQELVNNRPLRPDLLILIVNVLSKINESEAHQLKLQIYSGTVSKPEFIDELKKFISLVCIEDNPKRLASMTTFFRNMLNVLDTVINAFPSIVNEKLKSTLVALNLSMKNLKDKGTEVTDSLFEQLKDLTDQVNSSIEHKTKIDKTQQNFSKKEVFLPPNSYRDVPLVPTKEDFLTDKGFLRQNIVKGSYSNVDHYLDVQFRLLREDFIAPLREGIYEYIESLSAPHLKRRYTSIRIYQKVKFEQPFKSRDIFGFYIQFDCDKKLSRTINWEYNKRFMSGSLLLFSDDNFQTFYLATVVERTIDKLQKGLLFVTFVPGTEVPEYLFDPGVFFVMAESQVYYEAYKPVLFALQRMTEKNFPMKQYIVDVDTAAFPPAYLINDSVYEISGHEVDLLDDRSWPTPDQLKLNPSQHQALKSALTNDFVVIQGPPGTGKTFLALKITEIFLKNEVSEHTPIVVICYTNHALDQFLEGILKFTTNLIRIGMQSHNEALQEFNLEEVRKRERSARNFNFSAIFGDLLSEKHDIQAKLQAVKDKIDELGTPKGILDFSVLRSVITPQQFNELIGNEVNWLLCCDNPEFLSDDDEEEEEDETSSVPKTPMDAQNLMEDNPEYSTEGQEAEEFEEELDEEENARRLADMTQDDFYEEDFFQESEYARGVNYSLLIEDIEQNIQVKQYEKLNLPYPEHSETRFYFKKQLKEQIREMKRQQRFLEEQFCKFKTFNFNLERFEMFQNAVSVWEISANERWEYYMIWIYLYICQLKQAVQHLTKVYQDVLIKLHELRQLEDVKFVQKASVVGLTTSGAAKRRVLLENLGSQIVIVEEAAEVLEAHIVTSLAPSVQHVILIGDHKQLKPNPAVFKLAKKYNMDTSLFERMINNGLHCSVLDEQHRMRPEIASLITPTIYSHLVNHPTTVDRPKISGIDKFVYFITHNKPEDQLPDSSSKQNKHEADFLMALCQYLLLQDYKPHEITILATYTGQVWYMKRKRKDMSNPDMKAIRITPVDNFQGEENRIILLSLVRSNKEGRIGFLSTENRVCVALSRAREGLYVVGNMDNLTNSSTIWPKIKGQLEAINAIGPQLTLRCEIHPDQLTRVSEDKHFKAVPAGGCSLKCHAELVCGHKCPKICHIIDRHHGFHKCLEKCQRPPCTVEGHKCPLLCWKTCEPCAIRVEKQLPCGHTATLPCYKEPAAHQCLVEFPATLPSCGHEVLKYCFLDIENCKCTSSCTSRLPCGHACTLKCHINDDPDHIEYKCFKDCTKDYQGCPRREHPCLKRCYEECGDCPVPMLTELPCGHRQEIPCSADRNAFICNKNCTKTLSCGHRCRLPCWVTCSPEQCIEFVDKEAPCGHIMKKMKCNEPTDKRKCVKQCSRKLPCGHTCPDKCCNDCSKVLCKELVDSRVAPACGHPAVKIPCSKNESGLLAGSDELLQLCGEPCRQLLSCGHQCPGACGICLQGRLHVPCNQLCSRTLICGHKCTAKCSVLCPPCTTKRCLTNCAHPQGKCYTAKGKNHPCFKSCDPCTKKCMWICEHHKCSRSCGVECDRPPCYEPCTDLLKCGHQCIGYCGEVHPPVCAICDKDNPAIQANPSARYVVLDDCDHLIEGGLLDALVDSANKDNVFKMMECPVCKTPIANTLRCRNIYLRFRQQVIQINQLVNDEKTRLEKMHTGIVKLLASDPTISTSMNNLMSSLSKPFKGTPQALMSRLIIACLLHPLAARSEELKRMKRMEGVALLKSESEQRLRLRLEYLAGALWQRQDQIGYQDILQIELVVAHIVRLMTPQITCLSWYDATPYTWKHDRRLIAQFIIEPVIRLSPTLRTRDSSKQWYLCGNQHLYVSESGEPCITCTNEQEENQRRLEEEALRNKKQPTNRDRTPRPAHGDPIRVTDFRKLGNARGGGRGNNRGRGRRGRGRHQGQNQWEIPGQREGQGQVRGGAQGGYGRGGQLNIQELYRATRRGAINQ